MATYDITQITPTTILTNLIPQQASLTTEGWSGGSYSSTHILYSATSLKLDGGTSYSEALSQLNTQIYLTQNHIYYGRIYEYHETSNLNTCQWQIYWPIAEPSFNKTIFGSQNTWNMLSARNNRTNWSSGNNSLRIDFNNNYQSGSVWYNGLMLIDLTSSYGAGNEPTQAWCDTNIPFFTGSMSIQGTKLKNRDIINCPYSGSAKSITLPKGAYKLEVWGAQGGGYSTTYVGGKGGYATGTLSINNDTTVYLYVGGQGTSVSTSTTGGNGGYNGGGRGGNGSSSTYGIAGSGGGGASDIRLSGTALSNRIIIAGGGGGSGGPGSGGSTSLSANTATTGGAAGVAGNNSTGTSYGGTGGGAGTTSSGGTGGSVTTNSTTSTDSTYYAGGGGGGGGGYYGGGGGGGGSLSGSSQKGSVGSAGTSGTGGTGGASYTYGATAYYGSGGGSGGGGSSYAATSLTSTSTSNGNASFIGTDGSSETGHSGNGYIRITILKIQSINARININNQWKTVSSCYINVNGTWKQATEFHPILEESETGYEIIVPGVVIIK